MKNVCTSWNDHGIDLQASIVVERHIFRKFRHISFYIKNTGYNLKHALQVVCWITLNITWNLSAKKRRKKKEKRKMFKFMSVRFDTCWNKPAVIHTRNRLDRGSRSGCRVGRLRIQTEGTDRRNPEHLQRKKDDSEARVKGGAGGRLSSYCTNTSVS